MTQIALGVDGEKYAVVFQSWEDVIDYALTKLIKDKPVATPEEQMWATDAWLRKMTQDLGNSSTESRPTDPNE